MTWKTKRLVGTALWAVVPYLAWSFVAFDWWSAFESVDTRLLWLMLTMFAAGGSYTFPGWKTAA